MTELSFPPAFKSPDSNDYLLMTDSEGYLVQADDPDFGAGRINLYTMAGGLTMSWLGLHQTTILKPVTWLSSTRPMMPHLTSVSG